MNISLTFTPQEVQSIVNVLLELPYGKVKPLIDTIKSQADPQLEDKAEELTLELSPQFAQVISSVLGKKPFELVAGIIAKMKEQAGPQLQAIAEKQALAAKAEEAMQAKEEEVSPDVPKGGDAE